MTRRLSTAICALLSIGCAWGETKWIHMNSPNFEVYSGANAGATRDTIHYFERVRDFFLQATRNTPAKPVPVYLVIFPSEKEFLPYRVKEFAIAYYQSGADRDYIVMSKADESAAQTATHEYVHLVARHSGLDLPPWMNEGLAELYSSMRQLGDKVMVGGVIPERLQALYSDKWVPLSTILAADQNSPYYNEKNKANALYNEGWALVHMLRLTPEYAPKFTELVATINNGTPSVTAIEKTYGKPLAKVENDLQGYIRGDSFNVLPVPAKLANIKDAYPAEPAALFDVNLVLADLTKTGGDEEIRKRLEALKTEDPKRPEPWTGLGYLAWHAGQNAEAVEDFSKAYSLGARSDKLLWDYGRLAMRTKPDEALRALDELATRQPQRVEVRIQLASMHLNAQRPAQALAALSGIDHVTPEEAPTFFYTKGFAQMQMGDREGALANAKNLEAYALTQSDRDRANELKRYLERTAPQIAAGPTRAQASEPDSIDLIDSRPILRSQPPPQRVAKIVTAPPTPSVTGSFVEFRCENPLKVVVQVDGAKKTFLIKDPTGIVVAGKGGGTLELNCGAQKPVKVRVEFDAATEAGTDGILKGIYFE